MILLRAVCAGLLAAALAACSSEEAQHEPAPLSVEGLTELRWVADGADTVEALTRQPANCIQKKRHQRIQDPDPASGEALFNSPLLLGGQAAKAGISCASCHRNGRDNPHFVFEGVSGDPGTADISHGLFGKLRDDDLFNPVPIPDLALAAGKQIIPRENTEDLKTFLRSQIMEEFDGPKPSNQVVSDLAVYLQLLTAGCENDPDEQITFQQDLVRVVKAFKRSKLYETRDPVTAKAYINAGRAALGRIHARYPASEHSELRAELVAFSRNLQTGMTADQFQQSYQIVGKGLSQHFGMSLYDPETLRRALEAR